MQIFSKVYHFMFALWAEVSYTIYSETEVFTFGGKKMKNHRMIKTWYVKKCNLFIDVTSWFSIRTYGWNLRGYVKRVIGIQLGWIQFSTIIKGHK